MGVKNSLIRHAELVSASPNKKPIDPEMNSG